MPHSYGHNRDHRAIRDMHKSDSNLRIIQNNFLNADVSRIDKRFTNGLINHLYQHKQLIILNNINEPTELFKIKYNFPITLCINYRECGTQILESMNE